MQHDPATGRSRRSATPRYPYRPERKARLFNQAGGLFERRETLSHLGDGGQHVLAASQLRTELLLDGFEVTGQIRQGVGAFSVGHCFGGLPSAPCAKRLNSTH
jgi:hypothetical protein